MAVYVPGNSQTRWGFSYPAVSSVGEKELSAADAGRGVRRRPGGVLFISTNGKIVKDSRLVT